MKKIFFFTAVILATMTLTIVSCQKDNTPTNQSSGTIKQAFQPPQVDDLLSYLRDFKQTIQSRGNDETMTLDEAAWHLSSLANYDYGDVRSEFSDFHYDTLYSQIVVNNGTVSLADMNTTYGSIVGMVESFYQNTDLEDAAPRFIDVAIDGNGLVTVALMTSYRNYPGHTWYFTCDMVLDSILNSLGIPGDTCFLTWDGFINEQKRVLNILSSYSLQHNSGNDGRIIYVGARLDTLEYNQHHDPYGSPFYFNSRVLYYLGTPTELCYNVFAYTIDSYLDLAQQRFLNNDEVIVQWPGLPMEIFYNHLGYTRQFPKIKYGIPVIIIEHDDPIN